MTAPTPPPSREVDREALREEVAAAVHNAVCTGDPWGEHNHLSMLALYARPTDAVLPIIDRLAADADRVGYERGRREALEWAAPTLPHHRTCYTDHQGKLHCFQHCPQTILLRMAGELVDD